MVGSTAPLAWEIKPEPDRMPDLTRGHVRLAAEAALAAMTGEIPPPCVTRLLRNLATDEREEIGENPFVPVEYRDRLNSLSQAVHGP